MPARPARAATAGSLALALALALALPAAAFADEEERGRSEAGSSRGEQRPQQGDRERGRSETAPHGGAEDAPERASEGEGRAEAGSSNGSSNGSGGRSAKGTAPQGGSEAQGGGGRAAGGDPRGNNGTITIDGEVFDDGRGNEPHVGCVLQLDFYGFDAGDRASITFTGHAPTGGGLLHSEPATLISNDAAGGGQDHDATLTYSVSNQLSELTAVTPHPQQGWHVKVAVDVDGAPGGAKQKVFWIDCPRSGTGDTSTGPATGEGGTSTGTTVQGVGAGATTTTATSAGAPAGVVLPATVVSGTTVAAAERQEAMTLGSGTVTLAAGEAGAVAAGAGAAEDGAAGEGEVSAQGAVAPSALPFTGSAALLYLLGLGLSAVGVGAIAHRMGRQQADLL